MASLNVLTFDAEGRAVDFEVWLDDLQLFLQCDSKEGLSLFDLTSGASTAPTADADSTVRSQWLTRDAAARLAVPNHLPSTERAHFSQYKSARALYDAVVARYSSPTTAALSRLMLPYACHDSRSRHPRHLRGLHSSLSLSGRNDSAAMDAEMASWKSTGTYVDEVPPPGANIVSGMWIFRVKRPPGSPPAFKARYVARGFSQRQGVDFFQTFSPTPKMTTLRVLLHVGAQRDYELHSLDFSTAFLQRSLHEEIWLCRPPGFTGSFPDGTQWSLRRPVYGLRQAPRQWHDTLKTTLAALGFAPSTADPSLFLCTDTTLPPFYALVYVDDLVFATADTEALAHVKSELQKRHTCTDLAPPSDESVEPSSPYPELVGCLMYLMTCTRPDLAYPLSLLARYVAPGRHRKVHWDAAKRVLRYLCSTSGMGLVLGGRARVVLTGHADASWVDDLAMQRSSQGYTFSLGSGSVSWRSTRSSSILSSSCEAEIYAGAMAAQELR
ncbi:unnamed protein product [Closterium sp. NIES-54]